MPFKSLTAAALLFLLGALLARAQVARASLSGTVYDSSGAVVPAATVTVIDRERNTRSARSTNEAGRFLFSDLNPGHFDLEASKPGFKKIRTAGIVLEVSEKLELNPKLETGADKRIGDGDCRRGGTGEGERNGERRGWRQGSLRPAPQCQGFLFPVAVGTECPRRRAGRFERGGSVDQRRQNVGRGGGRGRVAGHCHRSESGPGGSQPGLQRRPG
jgi:Carboxypeptidase regulatory-like domain